MLAEEHDLNYRALLGGSCMQADVAQSPALHKHFNVMRHQQIIPKCNLFTKLLAVFSETASEHMEAGLH